MPPLVFGNRFVLFTISDLRKYVNLSPRFVQAICWLTSTERPQKLGLTWAYISDLSPRFVL